MELNNAQSIRFGSIQNARRFCQDFSPYITTNTITPANLLTPANVHFATPLRSSQNVQTVLDAAYQRHPERFVKHAPLHPPLPHAVWINPPASNKEFTP